MEALGLNGRSLRASRVGLGTGAIGGWRWGGTDEARSIRALVSAPEHGITLIATAPVDGFGRCEEIVGRALTRGHLGDAVVLATKCALAWDGQGNVVRNASRARIGISGARRSRFAVGSARVCGG